MRAWMAILITGLVACGKDVPAAPAPPAGRSDSRLDELLRGWERETRGIQNVYCKFQVETLDTVFDKWSVEHGEAWGLQPHYGRLDLRDDKGNWRIFISTGKAIHQYESKTKQEIVHLLPEGKTDENLMPAPLTFVFGMTSQEAKRRFQMRLYEEDARYAKVEITPRTRSGQQDFTRAKLVFNKTTHLPEQMLIIEPNNKQHRWIFTRFEKNVRRTITVEMLAPLKIPRDKGWQQIINRWGDPPRQTTHSLPRSGRRGG